MRYRTLAMLLLWWLLAAPLVAASGAADQIFDPRPLVGAGSGISGVGFAVSDSEQELAQTFTVGISGRLATVGVLASGFGGVSQPIRVDVRRTRDGVPLDGAEGLLFTGAIPAAAFAAVAAFVDVDVSSARIDVNAGDRLAIVLTTDESVGSYGWQSAHTSSASTSLLYGGGAAFFRSRGAATWRPHAFETDSGFRTAVASRPFTPGDVLVDPGDYTGEWSVGGITYSGPQTVVLPFGDSTITIAATSTVVVNVAPDGSVTASNTSAATGGPGTLTFKTVAIGVDPGAFATQWGMDRVLYDRAGPATVVLVAGLRYFAYAGTGAARFAIRIDANGHVAVENGISAVGGFRQLTFRSLSVAVDPGAYAGLWHISHVTAAGTGPGDAVLVYGVLYEFHAMNGTFYFHVDGNGDVTIANGISAVGASASLRLATTPIRVDPGRYAGHWRIEAIDAPGEGPRDVVVVRGIKGLVVVGAFGHLGFTVQADDTVAVDQTAFAIGGLRTIAFQTTRVSIAPGGDLAAWYLEFAAPLTSGNAILMLVPGMRYALTTAYGSATFTVQAPCGVEPATLAAGPATYAIACAPDVDAPQIAVPSEISVAGDAQGGAVVFFEVNAVDDLDGQVPVSCDPSSGARFPVGRTTVTCAASDAAGNRRDRCFDVVVSPNAPPVAVACCDVSVTKWQDSVTLDGRSSIDPDGTPLSYSWQMISGPTATSPLAHPASATPSFSFERIGTYVFSLVVSDGVIASAPSLVTVEWNGFAGLPSISSALTWDAVLGRFQADYGELFRQGASSPGCAIAEQILGSDALATADEASVERVVDGLRLRRLQAALDDAHKYIGLAYATICKGLQIPLPPPDCNLARDFFKQLTGKTPEEAIVETLPFSPSFKRLILSRLTLCPLGFNMSDLGCHDMVDIGQELAKLTIPGLGALLATPGVGAVLKSILCDLNIDIDIDIDFSDWQLPNMNWGGIGGIDWGGGGSSGSSCGFRVLGMWFSTPCGGSGGGGSGGSGGASGGSSGGFLEIGSSWWLKLPESVRSQLGGVDCAIVPEDAWSMSIADIGAYAERHGIAATRVFSSIVSCSLPYAVSGVPSAATDLRVELSAPVDAVAGESAVYAATLRNAGGASASAAVLTVTWPAALPASILETSGGSCTAVAGALSCAFSDLAAGATRTVTVSATFSGPQDAVATASVVGTAADPQLANNFSMRTVIVRARPALQWEPDALVFGSPVAGAQLNAWSDVLGTFEYSVNAGTVLQAGSYVLSVRFTPADTHRFVPVETSATLAVGRATPTVVVTGRRGLYDGTPHAVTAVAAGVFGEALQPVVVTYDGAAVAPHQAGHYLVVGRFPGDANYAPADAAGTLVIDPAPAIISWNAIDPIIVGTSLGTSQLNATASVAGRFSYEPGGGAVLPVGVHAVAASFQPADTRNYLPANAIGRVTVTFALCSVDVLTAGRGAVHVSLRLCDASGGNRSLSSIAVSATALIAEDGTTFRPKPLGPRSAAAVFHYEEWSGAYRLRLDVRDLAPGSYRLWLGVTGDPVTHDIPITVR